MLEHKNNKIIIVFAIPNFIVGGAERVFLNILSNIDRSKFLIVGINNPLFATRKSQLFKKIIDESNRSIIVAPTIDSHEVPQGIAGNSAYVIKPKGAEKMLKLVDEHGLWPTCTGSGRGTGSGRHRAMPRKPRGGTRHCAVAA